MPITENHTFHTFPQVPFTMIYVKGSSFEMGSEEYDDEKPIHTVNVQDFWIGEFPVTQAIWEAVTGASIAHEVVERSRNASNPSHFKGERNPVEKVSWDDICTGEMCFLAKLNALLKDELAAKGFKGFCLPSEAQWEYAARGSIYWQNRCRYAGSNLIEEVAWYDDNSHGSTMPVGMKKPNELGIYDMSGNVWEWCADHWHENYKGAPTDGSAWTMQNFNIAKNELNFRVLRGGSWLDVDFNCSVSVRLRDSSNRRNVVDGFRLSLFI